jgi:hypothetical protein
VGAIRHPATVNWCMIAAEHGYTDQAHFIHDYRDFTGITPTAYCPSSLNRRNHVPLALPAASDLFLQDKPAAVLYRETGGKIP